MASLHSDRNGVMDLARSWVVTHRLFIEGLDAPDVGQEDLERMGSLWQAQEQQIVTFEGHLAANVLPLIGEELRPELILHLIGLPGSHQLGSDLGHGESYHGRGGPATGECSATLAASNTLVYVMEWTKTSDGWRSGPYLIELLEPGRWALHRSPESDASDSLVRVDPEITGGSLHRMKEKAESMQRQRRDAVARRRMLMVFLTATVFLLAALGRPEGIGVILAIASFGVMLWSGLRLLHDKSEPWESLRHIYQ